MGQVWSSGSLTQRALMPGLTILTYLTLGICVDSVQFDGTARRSFYPRGKLVAACPLTSPGPASPSSPTVWPVLLVRGPRTHHLLLRWDWGCLAGPGHAELSRVTEIWWGTGLATQGSGEPGARVLGSSPDVVDNLVPCEAEHN